jgi:hypothetical protein
MRKMEEEIFVANSKGDVKALGMKINCAPADLHIYVNGVDIGCVYRISIQPTKPKLFLSLSFSFPPTHSLLCSLTQEKHT